METNRVIAVYQQGYQKGLLDGGRRPMNRGTQFKNMAQTFRERLMQGLNQDKKRFNAYRQNRQRISNNRRKYANMNYNAKLMKYVPKGSATKVNVGGFKTNVFVNKKKGFFERLNPFSGTRLFGPSKPGYVNSNGIARTSNYRNKLNAAAAIRVVPTTAKNNAAAIPYVNNTLSSQRLYAKLRNLKMNRKNYRTNNGYSKLTAENKKNMNEALEVISLPVRNRNFSSI